MPNKELKLKNKNELQKSHERTTQEKVFVPEVDIFENDEMLFLQVNMPGVDKEAVDVHLDNNLLMMSGKIKREEYADLAPVYSEYNVGNYERVFEIGRVVDQSKIEASMKDGVLNLILFKIENAKPRTIEIK